MKIAYILFLLCFSLRLFSQQATDTFTLNHLYKNEKQMVEFVSLISSDKEKDNFKNILLKEDSTTLKKAFYLFWKSRNQANPREAYDEYQNRLRYAKENFSYGKIRGFATDRGKTVLKYGKPDFVTPYIEEPAAYPYEIWEYSQIKTQSHVKFIFYDRTNVGYRYDLLHSDLDGERHNGDWKSVIYGRVKKGNNINSFGNNAADRYKE